MLKCNQKILMLNMINIFKEKSVFFKKHWDINFPLFFDGGYSLD